MKDKKNVSIIVVLIVIVIALAGTCIYLLTKNNDDNTVYEGKAHEINNLVETDKKLPTFSVTVSGDYTGLINNQFVKEDSIKVYEFDATIDNGWDAVTNKYVGIRLNDLIKYYQLDNFTTIDFSSLDDISIKYLKKDITDNTFLVFYKDGKLIDNTGRPMLLAVDYEYRYSLENVFDMKFMVAESDRVDTDNE